MLPAPYRNTEWPLPGGTAALRALILATIAERDGLSQVRVGGGRQASAVTP